MSTESRRVSSAWALTRVMILAFAVMAAAACSRPEKRAESAPAEAAAPPDSFDVLFETTRGPVEIRVRRAWSPRGADRLFTLVTQHFYDDTRFYRVIPGFMAQFGASGSPDVARRWADSMIQDDSVAQSNARGMVSFASSGPNTRTTHLFINTADNARLDAMGFSPVGQVMSGMAAVDSLYAGYGEGAPYGQGPDQAEIAASGNAYLDSAFPKLDHIRTARVVRQWPG